MELKHIDLARLSVSAANMRARGKPDIASILPSVRARGVVTPLIVRPVTRSQPPDCGDDANGNASEVSTPELYEIVAGKRRYHAALAVAEETGEAEPLPCAVMEPGDDAAALEVSLIENTARLDPDEVTRWETFTRLVREGRAVEDIALTFGLTELQVRRTLALGNLLPRIRRMYRDGEVNAATVQHLTLASKQRQREWLALVDDPAAHAPTGAHLKAWLFGGASVPTASALFDPATYTGEIVSDLFGEHSYFASADAFWTAQRAAIDERTAAYREQGWADVVALPIGHAFNTWEHQRCPKRQGGKVYVVVGHRGEVAFHEGYLTLKEARPRESGVEQPSRPARPELTSAMQDYIDLHGHAAVRASLVDQPGLAFRVAVAHMITGSPLWRVSVEQQRAAERVSISVAESTAEGAFDRKRRRVLALLGFNPETPTVVGGQGEESTTAVLAKLIALDNEAVLDVLAIAMGETLFARDPVVDALGEHMGVDMADLWTADAAFLESLRDREVLTAMVAEVAGAEAALANAKATSAVLRGIIRDAVRGENGRKRRDRWVPRWMAFPASDYTARGGAGSVRRTAQVAGVLPTAERRERDAPVTPEPLPQAA